MAQEMCTWCEQPATGTAPHHTKTEGVQEMPSCEECGGLDYRPTEPWCSTCRVHHRLEECCTAAPTPATPPTSVRLPADYEQDPATGLNQGRSHVDVPIEYESDLPTLGEHRRSAYGPCPIVLREWNEQVLLHEVLHILLDGAVPTSDLDPHGHRTIARVEVAMWETGWRLSGGAS